MNKVKVLFLSANPVATPKLQLDEEIRQIGIKLRAAEYRDALDFVPRFAARPDDLLQALLEHKPEIVHFSGHGSAAQELIFVDDQGNEKPVTKEALVQLFRILKDNIRLVLLNACSTRPQAEAIAGTIDCTIGMRKPIGDDAAIVFAASFYRALGFGRSVKEAFELGKASLLLESIPEDNTPELLTRAGVDASAMIFVQPPAAAAARPEPSKPGNQASAPKPRCPRARPGPAGPRGLVYPREWDRSAAAHISRQGTVAEQVAELIRWAESPTGPGLAAVEEAFKTLQNP